MSPGVALRLGRVSNLPTVWTDVLAGCALAGALNRAPAPALAVLCLAMSLFYVGGMYLNDAFDRHIDGRERPERPIPSGQVAARTVFIAGFGMLAAGIATLAAVAFFAFHVDPLASAVAGTLTASLVVAYDVYHKGNPLSPVVMGLCRVGVYACAAAASAGTVDQPVWLAALALLAYLMGLTYVAKQENLKQVTNLWPLVLLVWPFARAVMAFPTLSVNHLLLTLGAGAWTVYALSWLWRKPAIVPRTVVSLIAGICLVDALALATVGALAWVPWALGAFGLTLVLQRFVPGT